MMHDSQSDPLAYVREGYDRWASIYDSEGNPLIALEEPNLRSAVGNPYGLQVLELGCGTGRHTMWLAANGAKVTAVDFSEGMLGEARRKPHSDMAQFLVHDIHDPLPFCSGQFDLLVSGLMLEHIRDLEKFFAETYQVIKAGGRAVLSAMHPAMFLRGKSAYFKDPVSGEPIAPGSVNHNFGRFVLAALNAGFAIEALDEYAPDAELAENTPRAAKYIGWPMLLIMQLRTS